MLMAAEAETEDNHTAVFVNRELTETSSTPSVRLDCVNVYKVKSWILNVQPQFSAVFTVIFVGNVY